MLVHAQVNASQYGQRFVYLIPTNLYGPGDKFHPSVSHVIPALMKKCVEAVERGRRQDRGVGHRHRPAASTSTSTTPPRPSCWPPSTTTSTDPINLGTDREVTIRETVETIAQLIGFTGELRVGPDQARRPAAPPGRRVRAERAARLAGQTPFDEGLRRTIDWYLANRAEAEREPPRMAGSPPEFREFHPRVPRCPRRFAPRRWRFSSRTTASTHAHRSSAKAAVRRAVDLRSAKIATARRTGRRRGTSCREAEADQLGRGSRKSRSSGRPPSAQRRRCRARCWPGAAPDAAAAGRRW